MSVVGHVARPSAGVVAAEALVDEWAGATTGRRRRKAVPRRGWLVRRLLLCADVAGLTLAFAVAQVISGVGISGWAVETGLYAVTLPAWVVFAKLYGLYDADEERTDHTTIDDLAGVFHMVTIGAGVMLAAAWAFGFDDLRISQLLVFWLIAMGLVVAARAAARTIGRRHIGYLQNAVIVGAGEIGQLVARKLLQHPEYGINVVGFVDREPTERREDIGHLALLGPPEELVDLVRSYDVERVIVAFSRESHEETLELIRSLNEFNVQIDVVPRLFEVVGPSVAIHTIEGLPLVGLSPVRISRSSRAIKRALDVVGASLGLVLVAPLFPYIAWRIKRETHGPVFFCQPRLGLNRKEFTAFKFRTMRDGTDEQEHLDYIRSTMDFRAPRGRNGMYKADRDDAVTPFGRWLRRTSFDELPQLYNVLRGDMSLVGPRPCLPSEAVWLRPHHFERFLVPAGITGLWQVTARGLVTFGEALEMDVAYVRGWSLGLDLWLLLRTPVQLLRRAATR